MRKMSVRKTDQRVRSLYLAKGIDGKKAAAFLDNKTQPVSERYRVVLKCQSDKDSVERHRKIMVGD